jgi:hypothetical protein
MPTAPASTREFAIRLSSIDQLFWEFDARPVAERTLAAGVCWEPARRVWPLG